MDPLSMSLDSVPLLGCHFHIRDINFQCLPLGFKIGMESLWDLAQSVLWDCCFVGRLPWRWVIVTLVVDPTPRVMKCPQ